MFWIRPANATTSSYRYKCSVCEKICHQVTGNCGRKIKKAYPDCTYKYCPFCGAKADEHPKIEVVKLYKDDE